MYSIIILYIYEHGFESDIEGGSLLGRGPSGLPTYEPASQVGPRLRYIENVQWGPPEQRREAVFGYEQNKAAGRGDGADRGVLGSQE